MHCRVLDACLVCHEFRGISRLAFSQHADTVTQASGCDVENRDLPAVNVLPRGVLRVVAGRVDLLDVQDQGAADLSIRKPFEERFPDQIGEIDRRLSIHGIGRVLDVNAIHPGSHHTETAHVLQIDRSLPSGMISEVTQNSAFGDLRNGFKIGNQELNGINLHRTLAFSRAPLSQ